MRDIRTAKTFSATLTGGWDNLNTIASPVLPLGVVKIVFKQRDITKTLQVSSESGGSPYMQLAASDIYEEIFTDDDIWNGTIYAKGTAADVLDGEFWT